MKFGFKKCFRAKITILRMYRLAFRNYHPLALLKMPLSGAINSWTKLKKTQFSSHYLKILSMFKEIKEKKY
jgi:hypothetical protein